MDLDNLVLKSSKYWPSEPTAPQMAFLMLGGREALYGGAAGGGKSQALLMAALQFVDVPGYSAILFRRKYTDLSKPGALMDRASNWLRGTDTRWNEQKKQWRFPSGAVLQFGYLESETDVYDHQGAEYHFIGFDELTQFSSRQYRYMFSRVRRLAGSDVPMRVRGATNPGGVGHQWVNTRFLIEGPTTGRVFVPARLEDNPHLDRDEYVKSLEELDATTRAQLLLGDWSAREKDNALVPEWTPEIAKECTKDVPRPVHFTPYVCADLGSRDLTVWLFAWWDFENGQLVVEDELVFKDPSTAEMIREVRAKEAELWPNLTEPVRRRCDVDWRLVKDFSEAGLRIQPTRKDDAVGHRGRARAMIGRRQVVISPRCQTLLLTLESAVWNQNRTDFARQEETGHADAWDALNYLIRNVDQARNPTPLDASWVDSTGQRRFAAVFKPTVPQQTPAARAISWALQSPEERKKAVKIWLPGGRRSKAEPGKAGAPRGKKVGGKK